MKITYEDNALFEKCSEQNDEKQFISLSKLGAFTFK